jgi:hypothetical protein
MDAKREAIRDGANPRTLRHDDSRRHRS